MLPIQMYNEDSELLFSTGDEDLRRVYLNQNDDSSLAYEIFENNENFIDNKTVVGVPTFEGKKAKVEVSPSESSVQHYFPVPAEGTPVNKYQSKSAGPYLLGPTFGFSPVRSIVQCLARKKGTDKYYSLKILTLPEGEEETQDIRQGKMLLHTEYSLLSLLHDQPDVIHHHGFFKDYALEEKVDSAGQIVFTGKIKKRLCLVLDCLTAHEFDVQSTPYINLQQYVIKEKKLKEREALVIFYNIVSIVEKLHRKNIVHRDLKLGNFILHQHTHKITITNFCLGKQLVNENDLLTDQRGSPAYISPDVLCGKPYTGKPSDMWALGVVFYTMLYGQFPFYDSSPTQLFNKIKAVDYSFPCNRTNPDIIHLIRRLLVLEPDFRMTAAEVMDKLSVIMRDVIPVGISDEPLQVVPDIAKERANANKQKKFRYNEKEKSIFDGNKIAKKEYFSNHPVENNRYSGQIPVFKVGSDARELTTRELHYYQSMLSGHRHDRSNVSNRDDDAGTDSIARGFRLLPRMRLDNSNESSADDTLTVRTFTSQQPNRAT
ncbi:serine/threonine-protein kinase 40-like [Planococcus citri]|uniref:serine/threonine-protein kinase 40-like n=1 Tax=Planococcus citri TaxID=170843 RepID=UPI0031F92C76